MIGQNAGQPLSLSTANSFCVKNNKRPTAIPRVHLLKALPRAINRALPRATNRAINSLRILNNNMALLRVRPMVALLRRVTILHRRATASPLLSNSRATTAPLHLNRRRRMVRPGPSFRISSPAPTAAAAAVRPTPTGPAIPSPTRPTAAWPTATWLCPSTGTTSWRSYARCARRIRGSHGSSSSTIARLRPQPSRTRRLPSRSRSPP